MSEIKQWRPMRGAESMKRGLEALCKMLPDNLIGIEIGSYAGESAGIFAMSGKFKTLYCVDMWDPNYYSGQQLISAEQKFDETTKDCPIIKKVKANSNDIASIFVVKNIDFIYIDGNHGREQVTKDIQNSIELLKGSGGSMILAGHDYNFTGVKIAVNEFLNYPDATFCDHSWIKFL